MVLVPATMELLGDRNWWFPRWLDRLIPRLHVEAGPDVDAELGAAGRGGAGAGPWVLIPDAGLQWRVHRDPLRS